MTDHCGKFDCSSNSERSTVKEDLCPSLSHGQHDRLTKKYSNVCKTCLSLFFVSQIPSLPHSQLLNPHVCSVESRREPQVMHAFVDEDNWRNNRIRVE